MKKSSFVLLLLALFSLFLIDGLIFAASQVRELSDFHTITVPGSAKVQLYQAKEHKVVVHAPKDALGRIRTDVSDGILKIDRVRIPIISWFVDKDISYDIYAPEIKKIKLSGSTSLRADHLQFEKLSLETNGSSEVYIRSLILRKSEFILQGSGDIEVDNIAAEVLNCEIRGSGNMELAGDARKSRFAIHGSGDYECENLQTEDLLVKITGSGKASVWAVSKIGFEITGSGKIDFYGKPEVLRHIITGSGDIHSRGEKETREFTAFDTSAPLYREAPGNSPSAKERQAEVNTELGR